MTLVDASYFAKIQASELLSLAWTAADKWERAPNVVTFTQRFNNVRDVVCLSTAPCLRARPRYQHNRVRHARMNRQMTLWVCHEVLESTNPRRRAEKITHFINIAKARHTPSPPPSQTRHLPLTAVCFPVSFAVAGVLRSQQLERTQEHPGRAAEHARASPRQDMGGTSTHHSLRFPPPSLG